MAISREDFMMIVNNLPVPQVVKNTLSANDWGQRDKIARMQINLPEPHWFGDSQIYYVEGVVEAIEAAGYKAKVKGV